MYHLVKSEYGLLYDRDDDSEDDEGTFRTTRALSHFIGERVWSVVESRQGGDTLLRSLATSKRMTRENASTLKVSVGCTLFASAQTGPGFATDILDVISEWKRAKY